MYFIEKIIKLYFKIRKLSSNTTEMQNADDNEIEDVVTCKHNFMPVDSTGQVFACSKCGYVISKKRLNKKENN